MKIAFVALVLLPVVANAQPAPARNIQPAARDKIVAALAPFKGTEVAIVEPQNAPARDIYRLYMQLQRIMKAAKWDNDDTSGGEWWMDAPDGYDIRVDKNTDKRCAPPADALVAALTDAGLHPMAYSNGPADPTHPCPRISVHIGERP